VKIDVLAKWVLGLLDALALLSVYATGEIRIEAALLALVIFLVRTLKIRLRSLAALVTPVLGIVALGVAASVKYHVPPIIMAAHVGIVVHALLWLGPDAVRDRVLRLSMGFVNLTLASALTADFYLFGSIFAFAILGSIYISLGFLESTFRARLPDQLDKPLPPGYLKNMLSVSFAVFLISVLLFPLIPRTSWKKWEGSSYFQVGYNETVDLLSTGQSASRQSGRVALRIASQTPELSDDPNEAIPYGLLKGRTLDLFDGSRWLPRASRHAHETRVDPTRYAYNGAQYEVIREPQVNRVVLRPYGAVIGEVGMEAGRSRYFFKSTPPPPEQAKQEVPDEKDVAVPPSIRSPRLAELARSIMEKGSNNAEKSHLLSAFYKSGFNGTLDATQSAHDVPAVLDNFLFKSKVGSCELFAASAAILLRLQKVPARVIAGYRVTRHADSGILTVLDNDAHAWVEYWNETRGWLPLDPTPHVLRIPAWWDSLESAYWLAQGKWYHWMINFKKDEAETADPEAVAQDHPGSELGDWPERWKKWTLNSTPSIQLGLLLLGGFLVLAVLARLALGFLSFGEIKPIVGWGMSWDRRKLYFEYLRYERIARRLAPLPGPALEVSKQWHEIYLRLRFGRSLEPAAFGESMGELRRLTRELKRSRSFTA
jgi:hypothetical protein